MIKPITIQIPQKIMVCIDSCVIKKIHKTKEIIGMIGYSGTLKPSVEISLFLRNRITPIETTVNASNVPILTSSVSLSNGTKPAQNEISVEVIHVFFFGV